ncbi:MAG: type I 3-dehydroquinate dehydratase [Dehalococcoidia bacterium]|jgi:3-dehydroquinate dehydratase type I|nr:type I 3-dehydroquinate dehydratase [Dehalococcoidia bacterium]
MPSPDICACITSAGDVAAAHAARDLVALYEVRIDLIGREWPRVVAGLPRPWIACNRMAAEGGACDQSEGERFEVLRRAVGLGAAIVDVELAAPGAATLVADVKGMAHVLVSHHDFSRTCGEEDLALLVDRERRMGADICKVVTTAARAADNVVVLNLARRFADQSLVTFAMGPLGITSRVLGPLAGSAFTYASLAAGHEAAPGQLTVTELHEIYEALGACASAHLR